MCSHFASIKHAPVFFKFKNVFPPNDKDETPPMLAWNSYAYVSASDFASVMSPKIENNKKIIRQLKTTYTGHYWNLCGMCRPLFTVLYSRKLFLRSSFIFLDVVINVILMFS